MAADQLDLIVTQEQRDQTRELILQIRAALLRDLALEQVHQPDQAAHPAQEVQDHPLDLLEVQAEVQVVRLEEAVDNQ